MMTEEAVQDQPQEAPPPRRRLRLPTLIGAILIVLAAIVLGGRLIWATGPLATAQTYCHDLQSQHYGDIYQHLLTAGMRQQSDEHLFTQAEHLADQAAGNVTSCDVSLFSIDVGLTDATVHLTQHRAKGTAFAEAIHLASRGWHIDQIPDLPLLPLRAGTQFCNAIMSQNYAAAYQFFVPSLLASGFTQDRFTQLAQLADQNGGVMDTCTITDLQLNQDGNSASLTAITHRQLSGSADYVPTQLVLGRQSDGSWRLTNVPSL